MPHPSSSTSKHKAVKRLISQCHESSPFHPPHTIKISPYFAATQLPWLHTHQWVSLKTKDALHWVFVESLDENLRKKEISVSAELVEKYPGEFPVGGSIFVVLRREPPGIARSVRLVLLKVLCEELRIRSTHNESRQASSRKSMHSTYTAIPITALHQQLFSHQINAMPYGWILKRGETYTMPLRLINAAGRHVVLFRAEELTASQQSGGEGKAVKLARFDGSHPTLPTILHLSTANSHTIDSSLSRDAIILNQQMEDWIAEASRESPGYSHIVRKLVQNMELAARVFYKSQFAVQSVSRTPSLNSRALNTSSQPFSNQNKFQQRRTNHTMNTLLQESVSRGMILSGPSGIGKTSLIQCVSRHAPESRWRTLYLNATYIFGGDIGQSEQNVNMEFERAINATQDGEYCVLLVIDQMEAMSMEKSMMSSSRIEKLVILQFISCLNRLQKLSPSHCVVVVGLTTDASLIDLSLRESGRLDVELEMNVPSQVERAQILTFLLNRESNHECDVKCVERIALSSHGMVAADLRKVVSEARLSAARVSANAPLREQDLIASLRNTQPSLLLGREFRFKPVSLSEMAGIDEILKQIQISIIDPMMNRERYVSLGISPPKGVLFSGPSGVGKTTLAAAVATTIKANFVSVQCPDIISKVVGSSSRAISSLFKQARACAPCVLFFDQFEAIARSRSSNSSSGHYADQMLSTLLIEMDGVYGVEDAERPVLILAASNRVDLLDPAILRPGRMDQHIRINLPDKCARESILNKKTSKMPLDQSVDLQFVANRTQGYSGAQLENICREAAMLALRQDINATTISQEHFVDALKQSSAQ
uniref:AAA+ ATPase domain-containing protein n=1 Tax=Percolomonas cosmopolitus TaxID=63605 RepID=A0A7S1KSK2_9EUKA